MRIVCVILAVLVMISAIAGPAIPAVDLPLAAFAGFFLGAAIFA